MKQELVRRRKLLVPDDGLCQTCWRAKLTVVLMLTLERTVVRTPTFQVEESLKKVSAVNTLRTGENLDADSSRSY